MDRGKIALYCARVIRVVGIIVCALFLPWFFLVYNDSKQQKSLMPSAQFKLGIENLTSSFIKNICNSGKKESIVGLITDKTGIDQNGTYSLERLLQSGVPIRKLFCPDIQLHSMETLQKNNCSLVHLSEQSPLHATLERHIKDLDVLFFDSQDGGVCYYQTTTLLFEVLKIAALYDKVIVVLDRPNAQGPSIEGSLGGVSGQALAIPLRYGMTIGELARYFNISILKKAARLFVVPMQGYQRIMSNASINPATSTLSTHIDVHQSNNLLSILAEVHPFNMGQETEHAYHCIALPEKMKLSKQMWHELQFILKESELDSVIFRFYSRSERAHMNGLRLKPLSHKALSSFNTLITVLRFFKEKGLKMTFTDLFDKALGTDRIRAYLEDRIGWDQLETDINKGLKYFYAHAQRAFIYKPFPTINMM